MSSASRSHVETVARRTTTVTVVTSEFEADVVVAAKETVADGVVSLTLRLPDGRPLPPWSAGAHVDLVLDTNRIRQYSLCGDPARSDEWRLGVLREPDGSGTSVHVHDRLQPGDMVRVRGPRNNFALEPAPRYLFIAGGIGITPLLPMIRTVEAAGADWRLAYGGRRQAGMAFVDELAPYGSRVLLSPHDVRGRLDLEDLLGTPQPDTLVYCCGPEELLAAVESFCARWPEGALQVERFTAKPVGEPVLSTSFELELTESGLTLTVPPDRSILSVVEEAGIGVLTSCEEGTCGTCETAVLEGVPDHRDSVLNAKERAAGDCMMICVSRSCTPRLVLDL